MRWAVAVVMSLFASQALAQPAAPLAVPPVSKAAYHKCAPGAHWYRHKIWRDSKRVWVGHCVPNKRY